ncbi:MULTISPECIES: hypothetical protein [unclassified Corynebacterium]|uniref:AMIN-like domain-containing (lipo)protein n=1 Tax=unclassified Corynebacterium TaxID=2624378 RepID=UPI0029C9E99B|nr:MULTISPECIES: hypothetical protein [unclassified Corynebacterium]WPF66566.1 hypothetical protein OLX12_02215 [Corynebacterium sp. 22KM0430]WPF69055.1 hypothetical protein OLW90_02210 [Corynebacterium sp. 21KM1197]
MSALIDAPRSPRHRTVAAVLTAGTLLLASCSTGDDTTQPAPSQGSVPASHSASDSAATSAKNGAGLTPLGSADITMKTMRPSEPSELVVTEMRTGSHEGFDRVVFEMKGQGDPGWYADYTDHPSQQGSGNPIEYHGATALTMNIDGTVYPFELGLEEPHLNRLTPSDGGNITDVISVGTFEGRSQFIIGLNKKVPYSVQVLHDPTRLVIDLVP